MSKLYQLLEFLQKTDGQAIDLFPVFDSSSKEVYNHETKELKIVAKTKANCRIAQWIVSGEVVHPFVWIDSEGSPNEVFCNTEEELISLLYFDSGFIYDILSAIINHRFTELSNDTINLYLEAAGRNNPKYEQFVKYVREDLKVPLPGKPELIIKSAFELNARFSNWYKQN